MLAGLRIVLVSIVIATLIGAVFGLLVGVLADYQTTFDLFGLQFPRALQWVGLMAVMGAGMGIFFGYGFLPEE